MNWSQLPYHFLVGAAFSLAICYTVMRSLITIQREHIRELAIERDDYRTKLHDSRDAAQALEGRIAELLARPDLGGLGRVIQQNSNVLQLMVEKLGARDTMFDKIEKAFHETAAALKGLSTLIESRNGFKKKARLKPAA